MTSRKLEALQRVAGNRAVTALVQRDPPTAAPPAAAVDHVHQLDDLLKRWFVDQQIVDLLGQMTAAEKEAVKDGYRDKLTHKLSFSKLVLAVRTLGLNLPQKLDWLEKGALLGADGIKWSEISTDVSTAPQTEKDLLKNDRWKAFFLGVCTNATIVPAMQALSFDLPTQLTWVSGEASARLSITVEMLRPLLAGRPQADLDSVSGEWWLQNLWRLVCNRRTIVDLVKLLFPADIMKQLHYVMAVASGSPVDAVKSRIADNPAPLRLALYGNAEAETLIRGFPPADQAAIVQLLGGTPAQQLSMLGPAFPLNLLTWIAPSQEWVDALKARPSPLDIFTVAGANLAWAPFIAPRLAELFRGHSETVFGAAMVNLVWAAYGDGSAFNSADTLVVFRALYGRDTMPPGADLIFAGATDANGDQHRDRYHLVNPSDAQARMFMRVVKPLGRNEVAMAPIYFSDVLHHDILVAANPAAGWTPVSSEDAGAVYYSSGKIVIGSRQTSQMGGTSEGTGGAWGAAGTTSGPGGAAFTTANALTYFENNVSHEIGHAVGARKVGTMTESGDDFGKAYGDWKGSTQAAFTGVMWAPVAMPAGGWPRLNFGAGRVRVNDAQVQAWLVGLLSSASETAGPIATGTATLARKVAALAAPTSPWAGQKLVAYIKSIIAGGASTPGAVQDSAYQFPGFAPPTPVPIYSTRGTGFMTYSIGAYNNMRQSTGWYSLSSPAEMFAEMYARKYGGGGVPAANNGKDPAAFFTQLETQQDPMFGAPPGTAAPAAAH